MIYNLVDQLIYVSTKLKGIYYFPFAPCYLDDLIKDKAKTGVKFNVYKDIKKPENLNQKFDYFWGRKGIRQLYYEHPLVFGLKAKLVLDMSGDIPAINVNQTYYNFIKYKFENVWPSGQHLTNLIILKLLENKVLTLHCGAFSDRKTKNGYLVFGVSHTGKSYTTFKAVDEGYLFHSEDLAFIDTQGIYTSPLISIQSDKLPNKNIFL